jgi:hypothetical protein
VLSFPKEEKEKGGNLKKRWYGMYKIQFLLPNNIVLLAILGNFEPNIVSVNVNKLKPYIYIDQIVSKLVVN